MPSSIRISENDAVRPGLGLRFCASVSMWPDQFELRSALKTMAMVGRTSETSAISMRPDQERKKPQARDHALRRERRRAGAVVAEADVIEAHAAGRKQRHRGCTAQHRIEPCDGADLGLDRFAYRVGRHQERQDHENADTDGGQGCSNKSKAFDADGRDHDACFSSVRRRSRPTMPRGTKVQTCTPEGETLQLLCDPFVAGPCCNPAVFPGLFRAVQAAAKSFPPKPALVKPASVKPASVATRGWATACSRCGSAPASCCGSRRASCRAQARPASSPRRPSCRW